ncbi:MAG: hypothetical protein U5K00_19090 [Melioribacteraceae bacterium]|nr:hypothetical protein [Melioribacteraceae bacterium]
MNSQKIINSCKRSVQAEGNPVVVKRNGATMVSAFVKSNSPHQTKAEIELKDGKVTNIIKNILIVEIPTNLISDLISSESINKSGSSTLSNFLYGY